MTERVEASESVVSRLGRSLSRREAIAAVVGLVGGAVLTRPSKALASTGAMQYGASNEAGTDATILVSTNNAYGTLNVRNDGAGYYSWAINAGSLSDSAVAPTIRSTTAGLGEAIRGTQQGPAAATGAAIVGDNRNQGAGVQGLSHWGGTGPGVEGVIENAASASAGVRGSTDGLGAGVSGGATNASAVGVKATHSVAGGTALRVEGVASFSRAGRGSVRPGRSWTTVQVPSGLSGSALILVTLQNSPTGVVLRCANRIDATHFKVTLNKAPRFRAYFAWFVVG